MIVTLSGSSGAGKTTIAGGVLKALPEATMIVSDTTRGPRDSDLPNEYLYRKEKEFESIANSCLWVRDIHGHRYGTREEAVAAAKIDPAKIFMMLLTPSVIDILRAHTLKAGIKTVSIYILSPQEEELKKRLWKRTSEELGGKLTNEIMALIAMVRSAGSSLTESPEIMTEKLITRHNERSRNAYSDIEERIKNCKNWDENAERNKHLYEHFIRNDGSAEETTQKVVEIIRQNSA